MNAYLCDFGALSMIGCLDLIKLCYNKSSFQKQCESSILLQRMYQSQREAYFPSLITLRKVKHRKESIPTFESDFINLRFYFHIFLRFIKNVNYCWYQQNFLSQLFIQAYLISQNQIHNSALKIQHRYIFSTIFSRFVN